MGNKETEKFQPDYVAPPGEMIQELIDERGMSQTEFAERMGRSLKNINEIIKGKVGINAETALQIERVLGTSARQLNEWEGMYRRHLAMQHENEELANQSEFLDNFPYNAVVSSGWMTKHENKVDRVKEILRYFGVATIQAYQKVMVEPQAAFRKSNISEGHPGAIAAWLRRGEVLAQQINCKPFDAEALKKSVPEIRRLTLTKDPEMFFPKLQKICQGFGVAVVFVPEVRENKNKTTMTKLCGAARWLGPDKAVVQLSGRYKTEGNLWFTFFHELGHIFLHKKRLLYLEVVGNKEVVDNEEAEANIFAQDALIPRDKYEKFILDRSLTLTKFRAFEMECGVSAGILLERLQRAEVCPYGFVLDNNLITRYELSENQLIRKT